MTKESCRALLAPVPWLSILVEFIGCLKVTSDMMLRVPIDDCGTFGTGFHNFSPTIICLHHLSKV